MSVVKKRLVWPDIMKGLGMLVVVFAHFPHPENANIFYTPFFMATFFFVSGYFFSPRSSFQDFAVNKFWKLLVPLFMFGSLGVLQAVLFGGESFKERLVGIFLQIGGKQDAMWFFSCIFTVELLFWCVYKINKSFFSSSQWVLTGLIGLLTVVGVILCLSGIMLPWHFETSCVAALFFHFGYLGKKYRIDSKVNLPICLGVWLLYVLMVCIFPNSVDMHLDEFGNILLYIIQASVGVYAFLCISVLMSGIGGKIMGFVIWVGQNTIQYYFFQGTFITVLCKVLSFAGITVGNSMLLSVFYVVMIYVALCIPAYIVRRFFPIFLGKR